MNIGSNTFHIVDRFGFDESGNYNSNNLIYSVKQITEKYKINTIEILLDAGCQHEELFSKKAIFKLLELKEKYDLIFSGHLPYKYVDISSLNPGIRKSSLECCFWAFEIGEQLGLDTYVLHLTGAEVNSLLAEHNPNSKIVNKIIMQEIINKAKESVGVLIKHINSKRLCIENLPYVDFDYFLPVVKELNTSICFDVGHLVLQNKSPIEFFLKQKNKIAEIHLHDVKDITELSGNTKSIDHQPLGEGKLEFDSFWRTLNQEKYSGHLIFELLREKDMLASWNYFNSYLT
jgi:sugar phosphate isomerase/epimerase